MGWGGGLEQPGVGVGACPGVWVVGSGPLPGVCFSGAPGTQTSDVRSPHRPSLWRHLRLSPPSVLLAPVVVWAPLGGELGECLGRPGPEQLTLHSLPAPISP